MIYRRHRPLDLYEMAVVGWIICELPDEVIASRLFEQARVATIDSTSPTTRSIYVPDSAAPAAVSDGPLPVSAVAYDAAEELCGELLLWVTDGYLSLLEYAWYTDEPPLGLPRPSRLRGAPNS
jgi:hypothetical protein